MKIITDSIVDELTSAARTTDRVSGYTHCFYRYPARFSPLFAKTAIGVLTRPGDVVMDPFVGGGTTLVEARAAGRFGIGTDVNELAVFVSKVKTTLYDRNDLIAFRHWLDQIPKNLTLKRVDQEVAEKPAEPYFRHMDKSKTWRIRRLIDNGLRSIQQLPNQRQKDFVRCAILNAGQWALDCRRWLPTPAGFRSYLVTCMNDMISGAEEFGKAARNSNTGSHRHGFRRTLCLNTQASDLRNVRQLKSYAPPRLILTSPPYPGVHVLYHRWQIQSRRETGFPYFIANCQDGTGASYYTFGDRKQPGLSRYFQVATDSFASIRQLCDHRTVVVQLVAFSEPSWQIPEYQGVMERSGFSPIVDPISRRVPNRKWYATAKGNTPSSNEVLLIHRPL